MHIFFFLWNIWRNPLIYTLLHFCICSFIMMNIFLYIHHHSLPITISASISLFVILSPIVSLPIISYHITPILSYHIISYHIISYHITSHHILSYTPPQPVSAAWRPPPRAAVPPPGGVCPAGHALPPVGEVCWWNTLCSAAHSFCWILSSSLTPLLLSSSSSILYALICHIAIHQLTSCLSLIAVSRTSRSSVVDCGYSHLSLLFQTWKCWMLLITILSLSQIWKERY